MFEDELDNQIFAFEMKILDFNPQTKSKIIGLLLKFTNTTSENDTEQDLLTCFEKLYTFDETKKKRALTYLTTVAVHFFFFFF